MTDSDHIKVMSHYPELGNEESYDAVMVVVVMVRGCNGSDFMVPLLTLVTENDSAGVVSNSYGGGLEVAGMAISGGIELRTSVASGVCECHCKCGGEGCL